MNFKKQSLILALLLAGTGCTGQIAGSFKLAQQVETFNSTVDINTKIDLLWVVDNSASMDVHQDKLRKGFAGFATKYMSPTWDIHVAVIPTDLYLANPAFSNYLSTTVIPAGYSSTQINNLITAGTYVNTNNPNWNNPVYDVVNKKFASGVTYGQLVPVWGPKYSKLLPGFHDGPIPGLCFEPLAYFLKGTSLCPIRDGRATNGTTDCLSPTSTESEVTQCVNTVQNDTVRSGRAIITTMPPTGIPADAAWTNQLIHDFTINITTGSVGSGSERGMQSVLQLLTDNESVGSPTAFFRPGSVRGIVFVSDEEDQTQVLPSSPPANFNPFTNYACDQAGLIALNGSSIANPGGLCCSSGCTYGSQGTSCSFAAKTIDGFSYTVGICPLLANLMAVSDVKTKLDNFFLGLDGSGATSPNYFVVSIVPADGTTIQSMQTSRFNDDAAAGAAKLWAVDRGDRYIDLGNQVGNGSMVMNIGATDYSPLLDAIGNAIIAKKSTFTLARAPTSTEEMFVQILHANGTVTTVDPTYYTISGNNLIISNYTFLLGLSASDKILISYQPKTLY